MADLSHAEWRRRLVHFSKNLKTLHAHNHRAGEMLAAENLLRQRRRPLQLRHCSLSVQHLARTEP
jgi:hypothetical protein